MLHVKLTAGTASTLASFPSEWEGEGGVIGLSLEFRV